MRAVRPPHRGLAARQTACAGNCVLIECNPNNLARPEPGRLPGRRATLCCRSDVARGTDAGRVGRYPRGRGGGVDVRADLGRGARRVGRRRHQDRAPRRAATRSAAWCRRAWSRAATASTSCSRCRTAASARSASTSPPRAAASCCTGWSRPPTCSSPTTFPRCASVWASTVEQIRARNPNVIYVRGSGSASGVRRRIAGVSTARRSGDAPGLAMAFKDPAAEWPPDQRPAFGDVLGRPDDRRRHRGRAGAARAHRHAVGRRRVAARHGHVGARARHHRGEALRGRRAPDLRPRLDAEPARGHVPDEGRPVHHLAAAAGRPLLARPVRAPRPARPRRRPALQGRRGALRAPRRVHPGAARDLPARAPTTSGASASTR